MNINRWEYCSRHLGLHAKNVYLVLLGTWELKYPVNWWTTDRDELIGRIYSSKCKCKNNFFTLMVFCLWSLFFLQVHHCTYAWNQSFSTDVNVETAGKKLRLTQCWWNVCCLQCCLCVPVRWHVKWTQQHYLSQCWRSVRGCCHWWWQVSLTELAVVWLTVSFSLWFVSHIAVFIIVS